MVETGGGQKCCNQIFLNPSTYRLEQQCVTGYEETEDGVECNAHQCSSQDSGHSGCPDGWIRQQKSCYTYTKEQLPWTEAMEKCRTQGGDLVSIQDIRENQFVATLLPVGLFWTGANNINHDQEWMWSDGTDWEFSNLKNVSGYGSIVLEFTGNWKVVKSGSEERLWFVCEKTVEGKEDETTTESADDDSNGGEGYMASRDEEDQEEGIMETAGVVLIVFLTLVTALIVGVMVRSRRMRVRKESEERELSQFQDKYDSTDSIQE